MPDDTSAEALRELLGLPADACEHHVLLKVSALRWAAHRTEALVESYQDAATVALGLTGPVNHRVLISLLPELRRELDQLAAVPR
jgi:hypothetical protein